MYSPFYYGNGITPKEDLKSGYPNKDSLMKLKGFKDWQHFITHYVVYVNKDEKDNLFYNCEKR